MVSKFGRTFSLEVGTADDTTLFLALPFTVEFDITRNTLSSANVCQIRIYNLSEENRNKVRFNASNYGEIRPVVLKAGYGATPPVVFSGNISQAWSVREGVNFITQIECYDGGFDFGNATSDTSFPAGTTRQAVITSLAGSLPQSSLGAVGDYPGTLPRGNTYNGNTTDILTELTGGGFFIDKGKANALNTDEYIVNVGGVTVISSDSGLLGTPVLEQTIVRFDMVFEPGLDVGQKILLDSVTEQNFNGEYKVTGVKHRGIISPVVCGTVITTGEFFYTKILTGVVQP